MTVDTESLSCRELVELVTDYLEGALSPGELQRFERHISGCDNCTLYLAQMRETIRITGTITTDDLSPEAERELLIAFRGWASTSLRDQAGPASPG
jgi:anti-sigma factor RsiW